MGQPVAADASWARRNKPIWRASADPVGQPVRPYHEFLNRFFIQPFAFQKNPHMNVAASLVIGRQCFVFMFRFSWSEARQAPSVTANTLPSECNDTSLRHPLFRLH